ncbi:MAG: VCBS repeat-containing protein [Candidatus Sumerlaeota bacterium]|nr:VCBS repeat-containing protein [Candidatus Sumerlaeota bacterium]
MADRGISWFRNMGGGTFEGMTLGANGYDIAGIDREGDGDIDLVSTYYSAQTWWINDGHGNFAPSEFHWSASGGTAVYAADLNGDREAEVVLSTYSGGGAVGWVERVGGAYVEHRLAPFGGARDCWAGDLDCDGDNDIVGISDSQGVHWWENRGGGQFLVHGLVTSGSFQCVTGADLDRDGDTELIVGADGISYWPNQWRSPGPAPALTSVGDAGGGALGVQWANTNDMPAQYLGIAYDIYGQQWAPIQGTGSPWQPFAPTALAGEMPLGQSGGYHLWLGSQFFFNELLLCRNPWTGILYDAAPHSPLQFLATASDIVGWPFGRQVDLKWKSDIYGTWQYQLIAYKLDKGWVQTYSLADGNSFWHLATYPDSSHLNGQVSLFLPEGNYWIYLRAIGWVPPYPASAFATAFVSVPGM